MIQEQYRLELHRAVQNCLEGIRVQNQVSAAAMEDAINRYLVSLKDLVMSELIAAASQPDTADEGQEKEEEESGAE